MKADAKQPSNRLHKSPRRFERRISFEWNDPSTGYVLRIDGVTYESDREDIRQLAKSLNIKVSEDKEGLTLM